MNTTLLMEAVDRHTAEILAALEYIWQHPQTGFNEWLADAYLAERFESAGYALTRAGNIPGFIADLDTGRPGPCVLVMGELDSLICADHPDADTSTKAVHACGHCAQAAALLGLALALREPGVMDGMSGRIRLCAVPAEELIELEQRDKLRRDGIISHPSGKIEFLRRGLFNGCDIALLVHTSAIRKAFEVTRGGNGCVLKRIEYTGRAAHAGGAPHRGINALYAATLGIQAVNALRETFRDADHIRYHPIITSGGDAVNAIPARVTLESYVRGASLDAIRAANARVNRALAASAAALGAQVHISDMPGYAPLNNDPELCEIAAQAARAVSGDNDVALNNNWSTGCTDMGDLSLVMATVQPYAGGASGTGHGADYTISNPIAACIRPAQMQLAMLALLLEDGAARAQAVVDAARPRLMSIDEYFESMRRFELERDMVHYESDGSVTLRLED